ncbi:MAG: DUF3843 family protein, partial [Deltaproteobacteria bacterium]|nr:DUF3843 family protein [Deltaproteobacteria bacterium]
MTFQSNRPEEYKAKGDKYLPLIIKETERLIRKTQKTFRNKHLQLAPNQIKDLAQVLVEFAEDISNQIGIWQALETYNKQFFSPELPFIVLPENEIAPINQYRLNYLIWNIYPDIVSTDLLVSPASPDLRGLSEIMAEFLEKRFHEIPSGSGIKDFFSTSNEFGGDVKRKLIWLGRHSYLFRNKFNNYVAENGGEIKISIVDSFITQETTSWSGLCVNDILAEMLKVDDAQKRELFSWYHKHLSLYQITSVNEPYLEAENIVNQELYTIRADDFTSLFEVGKIIFGSLLPWKNDWYWSGEQSTYGDLSTENIESLKENFLKKSPKIVYRYHAKLLANAEKSQTRFFNNFVDYFGKDCVSFPNGEVFVAEIQNFLESNNELQRRKFGLGTAKDTIPETPSITHNYPPELIDCENGIFVHCTQVEGLEIIKDYNSLVKAFEK